MLLFVWIFCSRRTLKLELCKEKWFGDLLSRSEAERKRHVVSAAVCDISSLCSGQKAGLVSVSVGWKMSEGWTVGRFQNKDRRTNKERVKQRWEEPLTEMLQYLAAKH